MGEARIHVLSGLGATSAMYPAAWRQLDGARLHDWPAYSGQTRLDELAQAVVAAAGVTAGDVVVGTSLGGMVACEIAARVPLRRLVLISSAVHPSEVSTLLRIVHPLAAFAPIEWAQRAAGKVPRGASIHELAEMFAGADPGFVRAMCAAIFTWRGLAPDVPRPFRIHGRRDLTIPPPPDADVLLDGGHLVAMTHATECVNAVRDLTRGEGRAPTPP